ncbi:hypothetical protein LguiA_005090 [Lonicera macranthoides]
MTNQTYLPLRFIPSLYLAYPPPVDPLSFGHHHQFLHRHYQCHCLCPHLLSTDQPPPYLRIS